MPASRILFPVDFSDRAQRAAQYARHLAERTGSEITLLHVIEYVPYWIAVPETGGRVQGVIQFDDAYSALESFARRYLPGIPTRQVALSGDAAQIIVEQAHTGGYDLVLMPTHGFGPLRRFLLGSVTAKVLHDSRCPVWTGSHIADTPALDQIAFRHILCAVDLGPRSVDTLCWAQRFASKFGAKLTVTHVLPDLNDYTDKPGITTSLISRSERRLQELLATVRAEAEIFVDNGEPAKAVCAAAENMRSDLLVIGRSHPDGVLGRLRTHAYAIIRQAPCPVVSI